MPESVEERLAKLESKTSSSVGTGYSMGAILAMIISWSVNKSILWAMIHGMFSWAYVIYYAMIR